MPTANWKSRLRSCSAHCDLEVAVEVRQCPHYDLEVAVLDCEEEAAGEEAEEAMEAEEAEEVEEEENSSDKI